MSRNHRSGTTALGTGTVKGVPAIPPKRPPDAYWQPGQAERPGYALIPQLVGRVWVWPEAIPAIHGAPAERTTTRSWEDDR